MDLGLSGKVALVTGGSRGIGRATALTLAREGCRVAICARWTSSLAWELSSHRIGVNTVCPGSIYFPGSGWAAFEQDHPEDYAQFLDRELLENRWGSDQEVADVITLLVSERARWLNGAMIPVDGAQGRPTGRWFEPLV